MLLCYSIFQHKIQASWGLGFTPRGCVCVQNHSGGWQWGGSGCRAASAQTRARAVWQPEGGATAWYRWHSPSYSSTISVSALSEYTSHKTRQLAQTVFSVITNATTWPKWRPVYYSIIIIHLITANPNVYTCTKVCLSSWFLFWSTMCIIIIKEIQNQTMFLYTICYIRASHVLKVLCKE